VKNSDFIDKIGNEMTSGELLDLMHEITSALVIPKGQTVKEVMDDIRKVILVGAVLMGSVVDEPPSAMLGALTIDAATAEFFQEAEHQSKISNQAQWN
jgi:hypothetical protein